MKIMTILGTRPEIIRLSRIIPKLDEVCDHVLVHTGQNYDKTLNDIFFDDLKVRKPDYFIDSKSNTLGEQLSKIFIGVEKALNKYKPDKVLILGDTNTSLCTVLVERLGYPVYHMEAGNRCYDMKVPEEKNRKVIDCVSSYNLPYTPGSRENLLREGIKKDRIFETGNPINEVILYYQPQWSKSDVISKLSIGSSFVLVTAHRAENVDSEKRLLNILDSLNKIAERYFVVFSCHPRTKKRIANLKWKPKKNLLITEPLGFFDFIKLESLAKCVISDSGTVQEECCLFKVPSVTIRDSTERPETVECGSNIVSGLKKKNIMNCFDIALTLPNKWEVPVGYDVNNVSTKVVNFLIGNQLGEV